MIAQLWTNDRFGYAALQHRPRAECPQWAEQVGGPACWGAETQAVPPHDCIGPSLSNDHSIRSDPNPLLQNGGQDCVPVETLTPPPKELGDK